VKCFRKRLRPPFPSKIDFDSNRLKFEGYVGTIVKRLMSNFQLSTISFEKDIHQARVRNMSSGKSNFSIQSYSTYLTFICLKEYQLRQRELYFSSVTCRKSLEVFQKNEALKQK
jgi:hypothetical protein